ncbi:MAG: SET domain-containing protein-lysine N-methyltransferase [Clostridia bacterium]
MKNKIKILTLEDYKNNNVNEDFYNPFDEVAPDTTPKLMSDKGGMLKMRKETFNINRVEYTKRTNGQYTVLSKDLISNGEIVEICPVIPCGIEAKAINGIKDHIFELNKNERQYGLVLGYGSLYQHSEKPNLEFGYNKSNKQMYFTAIRMIKAGEELTIDYGVEYWDERKSFNTLGELPKPEPKQEIEESGMGLPKNAADITGEMRTKQFSDPRNPANPVISGYPILAGGQS